VTVCCGRDGVVASGIAEPPDGLDAGPESDGVTGTALSPVCTGAGSGVVAGVDGVAVTSSGVDWSPSAQLGLSSTAVVPRRKTTSVAPSSGMVPLVAPPSRSFALCPVRFTTRTVESAGTVSAPTSGVERQDRPSTPPPPKAT
jgi:hypothetical protein